jgi:CheY-like chemotaxis protein
VAELAPIIREVLALLRSSIPSSISINCLIEDENIRARIHAVQMHQILVNLGINARDAITQYGRIDITLAIVRGNEAVCASCQHVFAGDYAQITVQDSGSGIAGEIMGNIFNPFFTTKEVGKGTGMGLAVVHGLVHAVAGHIMVQSSEAGTAISILLPLAESQAKAQAPLQHELPQSLHVLSGSRIMVVDDEPAMSEMMCDMLSLHGATVSMYNDPFDAMASFRIDPHAVDLVLTDETMPGMSGLHLARNMLDVRPDLKVVLYTGYSENVDADTCGAQGLAGFFYKPVKMNELLLKLQQLLQDGK